MKIGLLGGSFNPPHLAHIGMARNCIDEFGLDEILLIVAANPPHKVISGHINAQLRLQMTKIAAEGIQNLSVSDIEIKRDGKSYTVDTLEELSQNDAYRYSEFYLIVGADMLADLPTWYRANDLLKNVSVIAVERQGLDLISAKEIIENEYGTRVLLSNYDSHGISSSMVRERAYNAMPLDGCVDLNVELFIYENALYWPEELKTIVEKLKNELDAKRFRHTMGTVKSAIELAYRFKTDRNKARLAALLHDCARRKEREELEELALSYGMTLSNTTPGLVHAPLGAIHAKEAYGVIDKTVLEAIGCHTLLRIPMTDLDKILYLADKTEPCRDYAGVDEIRAKVNSSNSLDEAVLACIDGICGFESSKKSFDSQILVIRDYIENSNNN